MSPSPWADVGGVSPSPGADVGGIPISGRPTPMNERSALHCPHSRMPCLAAVVRLHAEASAVRRGMMQTHHTRTHTHTRAHAHRRRSRRSSCRDVSMMEESVAMPSDAPAALPTSGRRSGEILPILPSVLIAAIGGAAEQPCQCAAWASSLPTHAHARTRTHAHARTRTHAHARTRRGLRTHTVSHARARCLHAQKKGWVCSGGLALGASHPPAAAPCVRAPPADTAGARSADLEEGAAGQGKGEGYRGGSNWDCAIVGGGLSGTVR